VDDTLCGANNNADAPNLQQQLNALLRRGGFVLRKRCAYHSTVLKAVPPEVWEMGVPIELGRNEATESLGLLWNPLSDWFLIIKGTCIQKFWEPKNPPVIKSVISSIVAAIFDPLGLIYPGAVVNKIFLKNLLLHKLYCSSQLPSERLKQLMSLYSNLWNMN